MVTCTFPDEPAPTVAVIWVSLSIVNDVAGVPPKLTNVVPVKPEPVMTTDCPLLAVVGVKLVMLGGKVAPPPVRKNPLVPPGCCRCWGRADISYL